jgi:predicted O-linked N-acetylglucosamine transferase (SPINDLY family)
MTEQLKHHIDHWREVHSENVDKIASQIRQDEIDVLIDLSGYTADNRLEVFALKPAPVQITWLGYPNTTGLSAMDYRITDAWADPAGEEAWHSERLLRLPTGFLCYTAPDQAPEVAPLPALKTGHITYGSFNNLAKHNDRVIALWSRLLQAQPEARLIIKNGSLNDVQTAQSLKDRFAQHGITEQLELIGRIPEQNGHLALYGRIDVALDTFPYNGTTTTCEALWMGIPVMTLEGDRHAGRVGVSLLNQIGHAEWIAPDEDAYIAKAIQIGHDLNALANIRHTLRQDVQHSPLGDSKAFTKAFESALERVAIERQEERAKDSKD